MPENVERCEICEFWKKANNEYMGKTVGQCSKGYYSILLPLDRSQPYYLERLVVLADGGIACGKFRINKEAIENAREC